MSRYVNELAVRQIKLPVLIEVPSTAFHPICIQESVVKQSTIFSDIFFSILQPQDSFIGCGTPGNS